MNKIEIVKKVNVGKEGIFIEIDLKTILTKEDFISEIYKGLGCPSSFGKNLDALWDTITDTEFWVKSPLILIIKNYNYLFYKNVELRMLISDILIDLVLNGKEDYYYVYILKEK